MKRVLLLAVALVLAACTATGGAPAVARVESEGAVSLAFDLNSYVVVADASGYAQVRTPMGLPIYQIEFPADTIMVGHVTDPKVSWTGKKGDPIPPEFWPYVEAVLIQAEIDAMGLREALK